MSVTDLTSRYAQGPDRSASKLGWAIHHSAGAEEFAGPSDELAHLDWIDRFHKEKRGFAVGIGYHVCIFESGRVYRVGTPHTQRAHTAGLNHVYDGLCFIGTFRPTHPPSHAAQQAARELIVGSGMEVRGGHNDLALSTFGTMCPGGWNLDLLQPRTPTKPPFATRKTKFDLAMALFLNKTPAVPHDVQVQDGKMYNRYIVRVSR